MPIKPENADRYPPDWPQIRERVLIRARSRCEECGAINYAWGWRDAAGKFHQVPKRPIRDAWPRDERFTRKPPFILHSDQGPLKIIEIVLTIAHLDHTPENCAPENLRAWCQRCHLAYDHPHHLQTAYATRREGKAVADLFDAENFA